MRNSAAWSISGTSISAWLLLICPAPHLILNRVSAEAWDLGIPARIWLGFIHLIPDKARQRILDIASTQFENGSAYHQYQPLTKKGNADIGSGFNDDPLWLIAGTAAYLKETGDYSILDEMTPFDSNPDNQAPLMEHLRPLFSFYVHTSRTTQPAADWPCRLERLPESELFFNRSR